jgi:3-hydroxyisobutyrate dehydrogenase-like beta-hydroxyacid dehydrogenase
MDLIGFIGLGNMGRPMAANARRRAWPTSRDRRAGGMVDVLCDRASIARPRF